MIKFLDETITSEATGDTLPLIAVDERTAQMWSKKPTQDGRYFEIITDREVNGKVEFLGIFS